MNPILLIPARMASTRLPGKPLAAIGGLPMIVRVWNLAVAAGVLLYEVRRRTGLAGSAWR